MNVALFITCFNDTLLPAAGKAVVEVLERVGCTVELPLEQTSTSASAARRTSPSTRARSARS
jgi:Fe-S oxidoreductase